MPSPRRVGPQVKVWSTCMMENPVWIQPSRTGFSHPILLYYRLVWFFFSPGVKIFSENKYFFKVVKDANTELYSRYIKEQLQDEGISVLPKRCSLVSTRRSSQEPWFPFHSKSLDVHSDAAALVVNCKPHLRAVDCNDNTPRLCLRSRRSDVPSSSARRCLGRSVSWWRTRREGTPQTSTSCTGRRACSLACIWSGVWR